MTAIAPLTPEWLAARRAGIGASEIAAVLGLSPWESPLSLYWRKVNGWEFEGNDATRTGTILEPAIADWAERKLNACLDQTNLMANPARPWQLATPDRLVRPYCACPDDVCVPGKHLGVLRCTVCDGWGYGPVDAVLELKWTGSWDGWGAEGTDQIPVHYRCQVLWQCDVVGVDEWYLAVLGPSGFRLYRGRRDDKDVAVMVEAGRRFMARVAAGDPPPINDHPATLDTLKRLHPSLVDETAEVDERIAADYLRAVAMEHKAKALKKRREIALRAAMGGAVKATSNGRFVCSRSVYDVAEHTVAAHTVDRLNPPRGKK